MKKRRPKIALSEKQIKKLKEEISKEASMRTLVLAVAAMADTLKLKDEKICKVAETINRYAEHIDDHRIRIKEITEIIEKNTGIEFRSV